MDETTTEKIGEAMQAADDKLPGEWTTGVGEACGDDCYTHWYYHPKWEMEMYTDPGEPHTVNLYEYDADAPEDERTAEYSTKSNRFVDEDVAFEYAKSLMVRAAGGAFDDQRMYTDQEDSR